MESHKLGLFIDLLMGKSKTQRKKESIFFIILEGQKENRGAK